MPVGQVFGKRLRFPRFHPGSQSNAITTIFCNRKRSFFNHISRRTCCRYTRPSAFPTMSPTIPANKIENGKPRSARRLSWTKPPRRGILTTR